MFSLFNFSSIFPGGQLTPSASMCGRPCVHVRRCMSVVVGFTGSTVDVASSVGASSSHRRSTGSSSCSSFSTLACSPPNTTTSPTGSTDSRVIIYNLYSPRNGSNNNRNNNHIYIALWVVTSEALAAGHRSRRSVCLSQA